MNPSSSSLDSKKDGTKSLSPPLSLSLTHTHTHTQSITQNHQTEHTQWALISVHPRHHVEMYSDNSFRQFPFTRNVQPFFDTVYPPFTGERERERGGGETKNELLSCILWPFSSFLNTCCACMDNVGLKPTVSTQQSLASTFRTIVSASFRAAVQLCSHWGFSPVSSWRNHGAPTPPPPPQPWC